MLGGRPAQPHASQLNGSGRYMLCLFPDISNSNLFVRSDVIIGTLLWYGKFPEKVEVTRLLYVMFRYLKFDIILFQAEETWETLNIHPAGQKTTRCAIFEPRNTMESRNSSFPPAVTSFKYFDKPEVLGLLFLFLYFDFRNKEEHGRYD